MQQKAGKTCRVTRRDDIRRVFETGRKARDRTVTVLAAPNGLPRARCGVAVSKRHGNAVRRNSIKRLCREALRLSRHELAAGWDYMLIPRANERLTLAGLRASVVALAGRAVAADSGGRA